MLKGPSVGPILADSVRVSDLDRAPAAAAFPSGPAAGLESEGPSAPGSAGDSDSAAGGGLVQDQPFVAGTVAARQAAVRAGPMPVSPGAQLR